MFLISNSLILIGSIGIIYEDWKSFEIHISWYLVLLLGVIGYSFWFYQPIGPQLFFHYSTINVLTVSVLLFITSAWISIKKQRMINIFKEHFGLGDLLSILLFCIWFTPQHFLAILVGSCLIGILIEEYRKMGKIPLASYLGICSLAMHLATNYPFSL